MRKNKYIEAAIAVLSKSKGPLSPKKITEIADKDGLLGGSNKTPVDTMRHSLRTDINKNGEDSMFYKTETGLYDLRSSVGSQPSLQEANTNLKSRKDSRPPDLEESDRKGDKTYKEAAFAVLSESKKPLHPEEIVELAFKSGFLESEGKTPGVTMSAILNMDIKRHQKKSTFCRPQPARFDLTENVFYRKPVIYIITNIAMPDFVKMGRTTRGGLNLRLKTLYRHAGTPLPFELFYAAEVKNAVALEKDIAKMFEGQRPNKRREFYIIDPEKIKIAVKRDVVEEITPGQQELGLGKEYKRFKEKMHRILEARRQDKQTD